jgi:hypothetical protein
LCSLGLINRILSSELPFVNFFKLEGSQKISVFKCYFSFAF